MPTLQTLDRILQSQGFGTRRECQYLIETEQVQVNGETIDSYREKLNPTGYQLTIAGEAWPYQEKAYVALYKLADYECSTKPKHYPSVMNLLPVPLRQREVQPVGRLDADTTGLLLFTDDGQFIHRCTSPKKMVPKVYEVITKHPLTEAMAQQLLNGVVLNDDPDTVCAHAADIKDECCLHLTITEGKYHQVKRMLAAVSNRVEQLKRIAIGQFVMPPDWAPGSWHWLTPEQLTQIETPLK
ncbi:pseudouridine synthase [Parvibium lacunae]|uniref:Pseudouridine synthase n=1 Tax=Parvibium lacunae TaxID=1888893 RepID=A0A368L3Z7_9BURK|nr:pseudouridine synthase [Parvibium lacunae]RCS58142.1 pseudouridine synthase [Parvibium lacunae]